MIAAAMLAAGASTRMGKNKLALPWGDSTVLETTMTIASTGDFCHRLIVLGHESALWCSKWQYWLEDDQLGWDVYFNPNYLKGQGTSVACLAEQLALNYDYADTEAAMFFLGDEPLLQPSTIQKLIEVWRKDKDKIVVPTYQGKRGNPVIFPRSTFRDMMLLNADEGPRAMINRNTGQTVFVPVEDRGIVVDLDTEDVYLQEVQKQC
jgi:molybdenum cofactor cytidylyltransferase